MPVEKDSRATLLRLSETCAIRIVIILTVKENMVIYVQRFMRQERGVQDQCRLIVCIAFCLTPPPRR
jgi:hypothetical protein